MLSFSIMPTPYLDESPIGYALRLAKANGFRYIHSMLDKATVNRIVCNQLSEKEFIDNKFSTLYIEKDTHIRNPLFKKNQVTNPKVCLTCISESINIPNNLQSPFSYLCTKHQCPLVEMCSHCNQYLTWELPLLDGHCTNSRCGLKLKQNLSIVYPELTTKENVSDCLLAGYIVNNPTTLYLKQTKWASQLGQLKLINDGYKLLNNKEIAQQWIVKLLNSLPSNYPKSFSTILFKILAQNIKNPNWPCFDKMKEALLKNSNSNSRHESNLLTNAGIAVNILGIDLFSLGKFRDENLVTITSKSRLTNQTLVDVSSIVNKLTQLERSSQMRPLSEQRAKMVYYGILPANIILAILKGDLKAGYQASTDLISSILMDPNDLKDFSEKYFDAKLGNKITLPQAREMTGLTTETLEHCKLSGKLRSPSWFRPGCRYFCFFEDIVKLRESIHQNQLSLNF